MKRELSEREKFVLDILRERGQLRGMRELTYLREREIISARQYRFAKEYINRGTVEAALKFLGERPIRN